MTKFKKKKKQLDDYAKYSSIALQMLIIIAAGVFGGYQLDSWLENKFPVFLILFSLLGVGMAIYLAIRDFIK